MSSPSERAALARRARRNPDTLAAVKESIAAERERAIEDAENDAEDALTLSNPRIAQSAPIVANFFKSYMDQVDPLEGKSRLAVVMDKMYEVAKSDSPKNIAAATLLIERGYGKSKLSDEDREAIARGGVQLVYIEAPNVVDGEVRKELPSAPDFINAEFKEE